MATTADTRERLRKRWQRELDDVEALMQSGVETAPTLENITILNLLDEYDVYVAEEARLRGICAKWVERAEKAETELRAKDNEAREWYNTAKRWERRAIEAEKAFAEESTRVDEYDVLAAEEVRLRGLCAEQFQRAEKALTELQAEKALRADDAHKLDDFSQQLAMAHRLLAEEKARADECDMAAAAWRREAMQIAEQTKKLDNSV